MHISVTDYLNDIVAKMPEKILYQDNKVSFSAQQIWEYGRNIATTISRCTVQRKPVVVFMKQKVASPIAFIGTALAGCYYTPIDIQMPVDRISLILKNLEPDVVIYDRGTAAKIDELGLQDKAILFEDACETNADDEVLDKIHCNMCQTDLLYVFYTSGSTGTPKGVTISHMAVIDCLKWFRDTYNIDDKVIMCNQAPLYFDLSLLDVYAPVFCGSTTHFPPKSYYTFPSKVLQYMDENNVNLINWAPSAMCNVVNCNAFDVCVPRALKTAIFIGEVMPCKQLNVWRQHYPDVLFVNAYGPTEATYNCMYYNIEKEYADDDVLPLGKPCENCKIVLLTEENKAVKENEIGEICVMGPCLSGGYYNDPERSRSAFIQNPLNTMYSERMYKTGDLAYIDSDGNMMFAGRKDFQIKRLGYRIELGEIENAIQSINEVDYVCCLYNSESNDIIAIYSGRADVENIIAALSEKVPNYMMPAVFEKIDQMPFNMNGKLDRVELKKKYIK